jgi:hypothetical protein
MQQANGKNGTINGYKNKALDIAVVGGGLVSKGLKNWNVKVSIA